MSDTPVIDFGLRFKSSAERMTTERAQRLVDVAKKMPYNVSFLDDATGGIRPKDLILIGAKTGLGKTDLATTIAQRAAIDGKRVYYFALEAEENEIEQRMKYKALAKKAWPMLSPEDRARLDFSDWYDGELDQVLGFYEKQIEVELAGQLANVFTYYRDADFTVEDLERLARAEQDRCDLMIIDHLHYIDVEEERKGRRGEESGYASMVKRIRHLALTMGKPVILVVHLRKEDGRKGASMLMPGTDEVHGSSEITKIATRCIFIAPARDQEQTASHLHPTYIQVAKHRMRGGVSHYAAVVEFNERKGSYEDDYDLGRIVAGGTKFVPVADDKLPHWAHRAAKKQTEAPVAPGERQPGEEG